jgi:hypothetical protein
MPTVAARVILIAAIAGMVIVVAVIVYGLRGRKSARGFDVIPPDSGDKSDDRR